MEKDVFIAALQREGYAEPVTVRREAGGLDLHTHPFEAKALILTGEIAINVDGEERQYRPGDIFHLQREIPHTERYGPDGVEYLVGRRP